MKYIKLEEDFEKDMKYILELYKNFINYHIIINRVECQQLDDNYIDMDQKLINKILKKYPKCKININAGRTKKYLKINYKYGISKLIIKLEDDYYTEYINCIKFDQQSELFKYLDKMYKIFYY